MKYCERAIYELLKALAGGKVYAMQAPHNAPGPFVIFQRIDSERPGKATLNRTAGQGGLAQATIQIDAYAASYFAAKDLGVQIETILDGYRGTVYYGTNSPQESVRIAGVTLQNDSDLFDQTDQPNLFRNSATYLVTYQQ